MFLITRQNVKWAAARNKTDQRSKVETDPELEEQRVNEGKLDSKFKDAFDRSIARYLLAASEKRQTALIDKRLGVLENSKNDVSLIGQGLKRLEEKLERTEEKLEKIIEMSDKRFDALEKHLDK